MKVDYIDLLGKRFEYSGRGPDSYDCYGLAKELYSRNGITLPDYPSCEDAQANGDNFTDGLNSVMVSVDKPQPLDLIMFQIVPRFVSHCGVYVGHGRFVHIMSKTSVSCEELRNPIWKDRIKGYYRYKGLV